MTILRDISFLWSMLHIIVIFLLIFQPRYSWRTTILVSFTGGAVLLILNVLLMTAFQLSVMRVAFFTCTLPSLLLFFALSQYRDGRFFFLFCLSDTVCFWLLQITNFLDRITGDTYVTLLVSRLILFPVVELLFWRFLRRPFLELQAKLTRSWWLFAAVGAVYYLLIMVTSVPVGAAMPDGMGIARILLVLILMPLTYLTILRSLWRQMQVYENTRLLELQRREYEAIREKTELGRILRHDMRHHLITLEGLLRQGDGDGALDYVRELGGKLDGLMERTWCANTAVNAVLSAYLGQAEQDGCRVEVQVALPGDTPYGEMDLCVVLANVLENAVNACRALPSGERELLLELRQDGEGRLALRAENTCRGPVSFGEDGLPVPSRGAEGHGVGLQSVRAAVERYRGLLDCGWADGRFTLRAALFPPDK